MKVYPVIHVKNSGQARRNHERALVAGADGVFLIQHDGDHGLLRYVFEQNRRAYPNAWIGLNYLGMGPARLMGGGALVGASAVWMDGHAPVGFDFPCPVYAGVAFKYQPHRCLVREVAANHAADVMVTSGPATGSPPTVEKVQALRRLTEKPLGVASGLTPSNVHLFAPLLDCCLVATGVSSSFTEFDEAKLADFMAAARAGAPL